MDLCGKFKALVKARLKKDFPQDPQAQLDLAREPILEVRGRVAPIEALEDIEALRGRAVRHREAQLHGTLAGVGEDLIEARLARFV